MCDPMIVAAALNAGDAGTLAAARSALELTCLGQKQPIAPNVVYAAPLTGGSSIRKKTTSIEICTRVAEQRNAREFLVLYEKFCKLGVRKLLKPSEVAQFRRDGRPPGLFLSTLNGFGGRTACKDPACRGQTCQVHDPPSILALPAGSALAL